MSSFDIGVWVGMVIGAMVIAVPSLREHKRLYRIIYELRRKEERSIELTKDEKTVLFANLAGPVARKDGVLDRGELRSIYFKLLGEPDREATSVR